MSAAVQVEPASSSQRIPSLDGIRGIAVLMVLVYHAVVFGGFTAHSRLDSVFNAATKTGWIGVDLFFVLSGFLITGILYDSRRDDHYFRTFYVRRFLRIVPVYYAFLLLYLLLGERVIPGTEAPHLSLTGFGWAASYASNYPTGLDGWGILPHPVRHVWSLAIEEQFYLCWPALVYWLPPRRLLAFCLGAAVIGWLIRAALLLGNLDIAGYVWTPARLGPLALGAYVAIATRDPRLLGQLTRYARPVIAGTLAVVAGILLWQRNLEYSEPATQLVVFDALGALFAAVILLAVVAKPASLLHRVLAFPTLRVLGRYSYAMYLFHQPLILALIGLGLTTAVLPPIAGSAWPGAVAFALLAITVSFVAALVSWHLLEKHCLRLKGRFPYGVSPAPHGTSVASRPHAGPPRLREPESSPARQSSVTRAWSHTRFTGS
jgi:peptidoglycan/LPS O-acetylase OafA/YrhL